VSVSIGAGIAAHYDDIRLRFVVFERDGFLRIYIPACGNYGSERILSKSGCYGMRWILGHFAYKSSFQKFYCVVRGEPTEADHFVVLADAQSPDEIIGLARE
jgi:hypothetical protein